MAENTRVAVVTGGGRGIGRGIVLALADLGFDLVVNYRSDLESAQSACREAEARGSPRADLVRADVADLAEGRRLVETAIERHGRVDLWVNNAGVAPDQRTRPAGDHAGELGPRPDDQLERSVFPDPGRGASDDRAVGRRNRRRSRRSCSSRRFRARFASVNRAEYCVAKAGLSMVAQLFAVRLAGQGIRVYEIRPGLIETDMTASVHESVFRQDRRRG